MLSSLCGVAVWSDFIVNFGGVVAGIKLWLKRLSFKSNYEHGPVVRRKIWHAKAFTCTYTCTAVFRQWGSNCAIAAIRFQWTLGLVEFLSLEGCFSACERICFVKLSGLEGLVTYSQLGKIIMWKFKHVKHPGWAYVASNPRHLLGCEDGTGTLCC